MINSLKLVLKYVEDASILLHHVVVVGVLMVVDCHRWPRGMPCCMLCRCPIAVFYSNSYCLVEFLDVYMIVSWTDF
jgi:hypothetical protein